MASDKITEADMMLANAMAYVSLENILYGATTQAIVRDYPDELTVEIFTLAKKAKKLSKKAKGEMK